MTSPVSEPRCAALVGPYLSGKTTLLESLLFVTGAIHRKGSVKDGNTVGDSSPEARARHMSVEVAAASTEYLGDRWTFLDCPGSIEFAQETYNGLLAADVAVVVCEPVVARAIALAPLMKFLDDQNIPHMIFINKMNTASEQVGDVISALRDVSSRPLVMREVPILNGESITGYIDLVSERAYKYQPGAASDLIDIPDDMRDDEQAARMEMLETLADFDDDLLTKLLEDIVPDKKEIFDNLKKDITGDKVVPVLFGSAENELGVRRLLKSLRHDTPGPEVAAGRLGIEADGEPMAWVFKNFHIPHAGKLSLARVWRGSVKEGANLNGERVGGLYRMSGMIQNKVGEAGRGEVVALGRMEGVRTGDILTPSGKRPEAAADFPAPLDALFSAAIATEKSSDEVKLMEALAKLSDEDPSLGFEQNPDTHDLVLLGQGEMHLQIAVERLKSKFNLDVKMRCAQVPYKETVKKPGSQHARYKRQTGGHGQFGDVFIDIKPLKRGEGFAFSNTVVGGRVPKQFIPAVERGVREYMQRGPLGFPVVDLAVTLTDGSYHSVDSSEQSFRLAGRMAMNEGLPQCSPVLLEPIYHVTIMLPNEFTSKVQRLISSRRGQILGFGSKEGWKSWDEVVILLPQAEMHDLIIELRSITHGVGSYARSFDHLQELTGRLADEVVAARAEADD